MEQGLSLIVKQGEISVTNYEQLKDEIESKVKKYQMLIISDNELPSAKDDLANLRKLAKALNDERIAKEKEYLIPWTNAKNQIDGLIKPIKEAIDNIDFQLKEFEEQAKAAKREQVNQLWDGKHFNLIPLSKKFDERWLNKTYALPTISKEMDDFITKVNTDFDTIEKLLANDEEAITEAFAIYKDGNLDVGIALTEQKKRSEARKVEKEARTQSKPEPIKKPEPFKSPQDSEEPTVSYILEISGTVEQLIALRKFMEDNHIVYKKI